MRTEYHLEINVPNDSSRVAATYDSNTPFGSLNVGDTIHGSSMNICNNKKIVRIKDIQHTFWEIKGSHIAHKICVNTEPLDTD